MLRVQSCESAEVVRKEGLGRPQLQGRTLRKRNEVILQKEVSLFSIVRSLLGWLLLAGIVGALLGGGLGLLAKWTLGTWL